MTPLPKFLIPHHDYANMFGITDAGVGRIYSDTPMPHAELTLTIPDEIWIGDISRAYDDATFRILSASPARTPVSGSRRSHRTTSQRSSVISRTGNRSRPLRYFHTGTTAR